jgi:beta-glucanase (GH16 family)
MLLVSLAPHRAVAQTFELAWTDDFDGSAGSRPDPKKWVYDLGYGNRLWGNNEFQTYTRKRDNIQLDGAGNLVITAKKEHDGKYSSARIKTLGRFSQHYGRFEARIQVPRGPGLLPAFWGMGEKGQWPDNGEIDIMENVGNSPRTVFSNIHGPGYDSGGNRTIETDLSKAFHIYGIEWTPEGIEWFLDGKSYKKVTPKDLPKGKRWVFDDQPFYLLLNVAVGGDWPGKPVDAVLPQQMRVDWVKVWRLKGD